MIIQNTLRSGMICACVALLGIAGCQSTTFNDGAVRTNEVDNAEFTAFGDTFQGLSTISNVDYYSSDQAVTEAKAQFAQENYGNAGALFYKAVQLAPNDGLAWLGLAASSDRIRRFDLADRAYRKAYPLVGNTSSYYNNVGYSYLLRGELRKARSNFLKAYELSPNDPTIANNLELLGSSVRDIKR